MNPEQTPVSKALAAILMQQNRMLATAESCTGGLIAATCTTCPAPVHLAGARFRGPTATPPKPRLLGVPADLIARHGAVSEPVARAMAEGAVAHSARTGERGRDGRGGPSGGSTDKPVGTVWLGWCVDSHTTTECRHFSGDRAAVRQPPWPMHTGQAGAAAG